MLVGFEIVDALTSLGFEQEMGLITHGGVPFARLKGPFNLTLRWQRSIWKVVGQSHLSRFRSALAASKMSMSSLRPDFLLLSDAPPVLLIIEVKQSEIESSRPERRGLVEAMSYIYDAAELMDQYPAPHALVVGWNAKATPGLDSVVITDQDQIAFAIQQILEAWSSVPSGDG
jgi:hypothetical protein